MAFTLGDRVKETSTTTGTGDIALAGAATGYRTFASVLSVGDTTWYAIALGADWEVGLGTLTAATTLQRTTVLASSNGGALTSFGAGSKDVFVTAPATSLAQLRGLRSSFRQRLINGNFAINQRGVSGTVTLAAGAFGHDRLKAGANGASYTFATSGLDTVITGAGTAANSVQQVIEGSLYVSDSTMVVGWEGTATMRAAQGTPSGAYSAGATYSTPSGRTKNYIVLTGLTVGTNLTVEADISSGRTLSLWQVEPGTLPTDFERRDDEPRRCRRHLRRLNKGSSTGAVGFGQSASGTIALIDLFGGDDQPMGGAPTLSYTGNFALASPSQSLPVTAMTINKSDGARVTVAATVASGANGFYGLWANSDATAAIFLTWEP